VAAQTAIPTAFVQGDTFNCTLTVQGYTPSTASAMLLMMFGSNRLASLQFTITGTTSGSGWNFFAAAGNSAGQTGLWIPGNYNYNFRATETVGGAIVTVPGGVFRVQPDPAVAPTASHAVQMIALIEARLLNRVPRDLQGFTIGGQNIMKIPIETLYILREQYREEANAERAELQRGIGQGTKRRILARFTPSSAIPASPFPYNPV
jgi:hypothetical protein